MSAGISLSVKNSLSRLSITQASGDLRTTDSVLLFSTGQNKCSLKFAPFSAEKSSKSLIATEKLLCKAAREEYLAEIRIPEEEIKEGSSTNGTVYLTVYIDDILSFDEVNCTALYCLPVSDIEVISDPKFRDDTILIYDIEPGKIYKISFTEHKL